MTLQIQTNLHGKSRISRCFLIDEYPMICSQHHFILLFTKDIKIETFFSVKKVILYSQCGRLERKHDMTKIIFIHHHHHYYRDHGGNTTH